MKLTWWLWPIALMIMTGRTGDCKERCQSFAKTIFVGVGRWSLVLRCIFKAFVLLEETWSIFARARSCTFKSVVWQVLRSRTRITRISSRYQQSSCHKSCETGSVVSMPRIWSRFETRSGYGSFVSYQWVCMWEGEGYWVVNPRRSEMKWTLRGVNASVAKVKLFSEFVVDVVYVKRNFQTFFTKCKKLKNLEWECFSNKLQLLVIFTHRLTQNTIHTHWRFVLKTAFLLQSSGVQIQR